METVSSAAIACCLSLAIVGGLAGGDIDYINFFLLCTIVLILYRERYYPHDGS